MKILVFGDTHGDLFAMEEVKRKAKKVDLIVCLGDLTYFEHDIEFLMEVLNEFPKPVFIIHGNHETPENLSTICSYLPNVRFVHKEVVREKGFNLLFYGGDGFSKTDSAFERWAYSNKLKIEETIIFLHGPPYKTNLDVPYEDHHCGNKSTLRYIKKKQPLMVFAGHIHECEGMDDWIGETYLINPGPLGMIVDLEKVKKFRKEKKKFSFHDVGRE